MREQRHERYRQDLPDLVDGELSPVRRRLVDRHVRGCDECTEAVTRQERVAEQLDRLGDVVAGPLQAAEPPPELLDRLLEQAGDPGVRARVAVPVRGAVSGARPGYSLVLALLVLGLAATAVWVGWRLADRLGEPD